MQLRSNKYGYDLQNIDHNYMRITTTKNTYRLYYGQSWFGRDFFNMNKVILRTGDNLQDLGIYNNIEDALEYIHKIENK